MSLTEEDYAVAIRAHEDYSEVQLLGSLVERSNRTYLDLRGAFTVVPQPQGL